MSTPKLNISEEGGMAIWARSDAKINLALLLEAFKSKNLVILLDQSFVKDLNSIRLVFSQLNEHEIIMAVKMLK